MKNLKKVKSNLINVSIILFLFAFFSCNSINKRTVYKLKTAVENNDYETIFKLTKSYPHDKSLTSIEINEELVDFKDSYKNSNLHTYFYPEAEIEEINENCDDDGEHCKYIVLLKYEEPTKSINKYVNSPPYVKRVKNAKITFKLKKAEGNKKFTHLYLYDFDPLNYFDDYDMRTFKSRTEAESSLSEEKLKEKIRLSSPNSKINYSTRTYKGYWYHSDNMSEYIEPRSESYISSGSISFNVYNTFEYTPLRVKIGIEYYTNEHKDKGWGCNSGYYPATRFYKTVSSRT